MLKISNYSNFILKNISFFLNENENLVVLGENGAGKSTLAKVICGLIESEAIELYEKNLNSLSQQERANFINYIPPKLSIFDEYITLKEFLELSSINSVDAKRLKKVILLLNLKKLENRYCNDLSSGEKQLLLLASSLMHNAKITIFDELTANLDINRLKEVFDIFKSNFLNQKIVITHNLDLAYALKFKILFLKDGKIEFFGENEEFFTNKNLNKFYKNSISKVNDHLVVNL
ncbi:iron siderophore ABC transporter, ATP-binding protein [Malaciobacter marinus]|uniref:Iron ABC transporter ATP-binding protein n=1 Tax=Malaciobacter marinus TaxID=505249 RepID=A0A347TKU6_9BACT|nr:ABC transporter ATP-binding protein [Malaciobacter marinus]AXX87224.1 iron siderophore ABC transporter, ATP-binding protein [Malaciobacter marinus]PHO12688.1 iron ABC transporter ATP-binding protein [Malaciobacter marinus]PHO14885.1 iron ABC transporter ATP-binding protein [Malaciobacter marinus]